MTVLLELTPDKEENLQMVQQMLSTDGAEHHPLPKRIAGLNRGQVLWISDDFDAPLPDEFWLGSE